MTIGAIQFALPNGKYAQVSCLKDKKADENSPLFVDRTVDGKKVRYLKRTVTGHDGKKQYFYIDPKSFTEVKEPPKNPNISDIDRMVVPKAAPQEKRKLTWGERLGAIAKGIVKPIKSLIENPVALVTAAVVTAAVVATCVFFPPAIPAVVAGGKLLAAGMVAVGAGQVAYGTYKAGNAKTVKEEFEAYELIGEGVFNAGTAALSFTKIGKAGAAAGAAMNNADDAARAATSAVGVVDDAANAGKSAASVADDAANLAQNAAGTTKNVPITGLNGKPLLGPNGKPLTMPQPKAPITPAAQPKVQSPITKPTKGCFAKPAEAAKPNIGRRILGDRMSPKNIRAAKDANAGLFKDVKDIKEVVKGFDDCFVANNRYGMEAALSQAKQMGAKPEIIRQMEIALEQMKIAEDATRSWQITRTFGTLAIPAGASTALTDNSTEEVFKENEAAIKQFGNSYAEYEGDNGEGAIATLIQNEQAQQQQYQQYQGAAQ